MGELQAERILRIFMEPQILLIIASASALFKFAALIAKVQQLLIAPQHFYYKI
jgi:hypothetical protein